MSAYDDPSTAALRLSNADRDAAVAALSRAQADGRITPAEFAERSAGAQGAVTRGDLAPLFADLPEQPTHGEQPNRTSLPESLPEPAVIPPQPFAGTPPQYGTPPAGSVSDDGYARRRPLGGSAGVVVVSVMPFVALGLFFLFGYTIPDGFRWSWIFFALIPVAGIIVYGGSGRRATGRD